MIELWGLNFLGVVLDFVQKCNTVSDFCQALNLALEKKLKIDILVEEFYEGHEIDLDMIIQDNRMIFTAICDDLPALEPWFIEQGKF